MEYPIVIVPLSEDDGGGYAGYAIDLPGCMSDGDTPEKAFKNTRKAIKEWVEGYKKLGRQVPKPGTAAAAAMKERADLKQKLADAIAAFDMLDGRVERLASDIKEIQERLDHAGSWIRFTDIAGIPAGRPIVPKSIGHC